MRTGAASVFVVTSRSTCGWIVRQGRQAADLIADTDENRAGRRDLSVRRGTALAARGTLDRRRPASAAHRNHRALADIVRRAVRRAAISASIRQRGRSRRFGSGSIGSWTDWTRFSWRPLAGCCAGGAVRRHHVPFARGPDRQAHLPGLRRPDVRAGPDAHAGRPRRRRDCRNPRARSAKLRGYREAPAPSSIDLEYAIKKDVRNNPVIREVDQERQRHSGVAARSAARDRLLFSARQKWNCSSTATPSSASRPRSATSRRSIDAFAWRSKRCARRSASRSRPAAESGDPSRATRPS